MGTSRRNINLIVSWRFTAAHEGALLIFHFGKSLEAVRDQLSKSPAIAADRLIIRRALKTYRGNFPNAEIIRHATAHAGELQNTPAKLRKSKAESPISAWAAGHSPERIDHDKYVASMEGNSFKYEVSDASIAKLEEIIGLVDVSLLSFFDQCGQERDNQPGATND